MNTDKRDDGFDPWAGKIPWEKMVTDPVFLPRTPWTGAWQGPR